MWQSQSGKVGGGQGPVIAFKKQYFTQNLYQNIPANSSGGRNFILFFLEFIQEGMCSVQFFVVVIFMVERTW